MQYTIQFEAKLPVVLKEDEQIGQIIACCPILDVITQGPTKEEAKKNLIEALNLFFISCYEHGTLDEVMKECGFIAHAGGKKPSIETTTHDIINVKIPFYSQEQTAVECHA